MGWIANQTINIKATLLWLLMLMNVAHALDSNEVDASADEQDQQPLLIERAWDFGIGLGFGELSNPYIGSDDVPAYVAVDVALYGKRFFFDNGDLGFTVVDRPNFGFNLLATYSNDRIYQSFLNSLGVRFIDLPVGGQAVTPPPEVIPIGIASVDDASVVPFELPDRRFAINLGVELILAGDWGLLDMQITQDISSAHNGQELWLDYSRGWRWDRLSVSPNIGLNWKSAGLVDYFYGVLPEESEELSQLYSGESTLNAFAGLSVAYQLTDHWSLVGNYKYERLGTNIRRSPLIDADSIQSFFIGTFYRF